MHIRHLYLILAVVGTVVPWWLFASFFVSNGPDIPFFVQSLFANGAAGGFSADVMISIFVFWVWSWRDAQKSQIKTWWIILPASFFVGLSLAFPLYLYLREKPQDA